MAGFFWFVIALTFLLGAAEKWSDTGEIAFEAVAAVLLWMPALLFFAALLPALVLSVLQLFEAENLNEVLFFAGVSFGALVLTVVFGAIWLYLFVHCSRRSGGAGGSDGSSAAGDGAKAGADVKSDTNA